MEEQQEEQEENFTLNVTPKWENLLPLYADWYVNGEESQHALAIKEFKNLVNANSGRCSN